MPSSEISIFGDDETFYESDTGWTSTEESVPLLTEANAHYNTSNNAAYAYAFSKPTNVPIHSSGNASISETIFPSGSLEETYERYAEFTVNGEFQSRIAAYGSASANYSIEIFLHDVTNNEEIDRYTVASKNAAFIDLPDIDNESFSETVSGTIQQYTEYRIGVKINTFSANRTVPTAPSPFAAGANVSNDKSFNGYATWDSIELDWIGEAEKV